TQTLTGIAVFCDLCAAVKRAEGFSDAPLAEHLFAHLATTNGWDSATASEYVRRTGIVAEERRRHEWTLDLAWCGPGL
ncbi:hypothetical protein M2T53_29695, partial [Klebsiella pneumoniae]|nr:hypothetical protein [Klebsiella pneumoniae]